MFIRGAGSTFALSLTSASVNFLVGVLLTRSMGADGYGAYAYAIAWVTLMTVVAKLGLEQIIIRDTAALLEKNDFGHLRGLLQFSLCIVAVSSLATILLASIAVVLRPRGASAVDPTTLFLAFTLVPINALLAWSSAVQQGFFRIARAQLPGSAIAPLAMLLATLLLFFWQGYGLKSTWILGVQILSYSTALLFAAFNVYAGLPSEVKHVPALYNGRRWGSGAFKLVLVDSMYLLNLNADILLLGSLAGTEAAGIYKVATRGADLVVYALLIISIPLAPLLARLHAAKDIPGVRRSVTRTTRMATAIALVVALTLVTFSDKFLAIFGHGFEHGKTALTILCLSQLVNAATGPVGRILVVAGYESITAIAVTVGALVNIALNVLLIPHYGLAGAAAGTAISTLLWNGILMWATWTKLGIDPTILGLTPRSSRGHETAN